MLSRGTILSLLYLHLKAPNSFAQIGSLLFANNLMETLTTLKSPVTKTHGESRVQAVIISS